MAEVSPLQSVSALTGFDHQPRTRLVFDCGAVDRVGELAAQLGGRKVLLVTDQGIVKAGHAEKVEESLSTAGLSVTVFDRVVENPTTRCVAGCVETARAAGIDLIVGLGGGSSMDTAKGGNFLLTNGGRMQDYWGVGKASKPMLPVIAIPTTAGTGSECQCAALITDEATHQKMACLDPKVAAKIAVLDPELTLSQPASVTAHTGVDAIAHAVETAVTNKCNALSAMYSREAFRLLTQAFPAVLDNGDDVGARGRMQLGAAFSGVAIENSMLGAAHAAANPLTAHFGIIHGEAVGLMLPHVIRFNSGDANTARLYAELAQGAGLSSQTTDNTEAVMRLAAHLEALFHSAGIPRSLRERGVEESSIPELAQEATKQWTAQFNPRPVDAAVCQRLYEAAF